MIPESTAAVITTTTTTTTATTMTNPVEVFPPPHPNEKDRDEPSPHYNAAVPDNHHIKEDDDELDDLIMLDHNHDDHNDMLLSSSPPPLPPPPSDDDNDNDDSNNSPLPQNWRLSNAVHMELQENAKLPTFSWNVNRAGSSTTNKFHVSQFFQHANNNNKSRSNTMDDDDDGGEEEDLFDTTDGVDASSVNLEEYLDLTTGDPSTESQPPPLPPFVKQQPSFNLTEIFLTSEMGQRHTNFPTHKSGRFDGSMDLMMMIDPTPLSEIKRKLGATTTTSDTEPPPPSSSSLSSHPPTTTVPTTTTTTNTISNVPYWSRREQLPIPSPVDPVPPATTEEHQHTAVSHDVTAVATIGTASRPESLDSSVPASVSFISTTTNNTKAATNGSSTYQTKLIGSWKTQEPQHSTIHSVSRPAVLVASQKRTQYGFGPQHVVPSVPTTTTTTTATSTRPKRSSPTNQKRTTNKTYSRSTSQRSQSTTATTTTSAASSQVIARAPSTTSQDDDDSGSGGGGGGGNNNNNNNVAGNVAYERKKERAKSARIRLNESIDRLQIALNMAGTQSNQRLAMFQEGTIPYRIISDCLKCSEDAKKWDRPSFVGSAATMIQGLNAQCEALVRALHDERHARAEQTVHTTNTATAATNVHDDGTTHSTRAMTFISDEGGSSPTSARVKHGYNSTSDNFNKSDVTDDNGETPTKRFKLNDAVCPFDAKLARICAEATDANETMFTQLCLTVFEDKSILDRVASFLDPRSLLRCKRVCRDWKSCGVFTSDALWQRLAVDRFGFYNVRQWLAKVEDFAQKDVHSSTNLYMTMDATNIMPHCRLDGMLLLGESRLLGKVSAWTYMVERSNGETMRSVARHSSMPGAGAYTSLPIVQLRTIIQNTGLHDDAVVIREQTITVDASTRRRGDEMVEIDWDDRFKKRILNLDGSAYVARVRAARRSSESIYRELCRLRLYEAVVLETNIHARGCATTSKFVQKSNFTKLLVQIRDGTTVPLVIPFPRDASHLLP